MSEPEDRITPENTGSLFGDTPTFSPDAKFEGEEKAPEAAAPTAPPEAPAAPPAKVEPDPPKIELPEPGVSASMKSNEKYGPMLKVIIDERDMQNVRMRKAPDWDGKTWPFWTGVIQHLPEKFVEYLEGLSYDEEVALAPDSKVSNNEELMADYNPGARNTTIRNGRVFLLNSTPKYYVMRKGYVNSPA